MSKKNEDVETITIALPESLDSLSDAELETLRQNTIEAFGEVYQDGNAVLSTEDEVLLGNLRDVKLALDAEKNARKEAAAARAEKAKEFAAAFGNDPEEIDTEVSQADYPKADEDDAEEDEDEAANEAPAKPAKKAAAKDEAKAEDKKFAPINVARMKSKQTPMVVDQEGKEVSPFRAGIQAANLRPGAMIGLDEVANELAQMSGGANANAALSAQRSGVRFSQKFKFAEIEKHFDPRAVVGPDNDADAAIAFAVDQSRLPGGSLVAAGGWCAPSETLYDLCELESRDGLLSLPEVNVRRGGIRYTMGPDWVDIFANTGFSFTEAQDIAGNYSLTNEIQSLTQGGSGLTSYTLTYSGQTTASIPAAATAAQVQAALVALSNIGDNDVVVTGGGNPFVFQVKFQGALAGTDTATITTTPTGGTGTVTVAVVQNGGQPGGPKPCAVVPCPAFTDVRLSVMGTCVQAGFLMDNAYPELIRRYVRGALTAHAHRLDTAVINAIIAGSTAVSPTPQPGELATTAPVLSAIELQVEDIKYKRRMSRGIVLEAVFPYWVRGMIRADLSRRLGVDLLRVSDADISNWFRSRGVNAQFVYNFDALGASSAALSWPNSLRFILYPAGTWVKGGTDVISLSMLHDSTLNSYNNFTAIFAEEGWSVMQMCPESRIVTVAVCEAGGTTAGQVITC